MDMLQTLKRVPIFAELTESELNTLSTITTEKDYNKKEYIFMEGERREAVYFIESGAIKTFRVDKNGNEQIINVLPEGEMFPHVGFFDDGPYPATAEAIQTTHLLSIRIDNFNALLMQYPGIAIKVMKIMGQKILSLAQRVQEFISDDVRHRIIHTLIRLAKGVPANESGHITLEIPMTNQDFANMVGTTRETINRILNELKKQELIETNRKHITILDFNKLEQLL